MNPLVERRLPEIEELCRRHGVSRLELFGSAARSDFDPERSDVDLLVEFADNRVDGAFDRYFDLKEGLEALLGRPVDLVMTRAIRNRYFLEAIQSERKLLYAA